jgi:hypothetical protein
MTELLLKEALNTRHAIIKSKIKILLIKFQYMEEKKTQVFQFEFLLSRKELQNLLCMLHAYSPYTFKQQE